MRAAGRAAASVLEMIGDHVQPGVTTEELDQLCHQFIVEELGCIPAPLNYGGGGGQMPFPKSICTSVNHVVCHGIPSPSRSLKMAMPSILTLPSSRTVTMGTPAKCSSPENLL